MHDNNSEIHRAIPYKCVFTHIVPGDHDNARRFVGQVLSLEESET